MNKQDQAKYDHLKDHTSLTHKQIMFCILYDGNASKTARLAGYSNSDQAGYKLIRNGKIKSALRMIRDHDPVSILSPDQIMIQWSTIASDPNANTSDRLRSLESLAKCHAMFTEKSISLQYTKSDRLDQMSDQELNKLLDQTIRSLVGSGTIDPSVLAIEDQKEGA